MEYGYFDDRQREYVITNPKTPVKWINYIGDLSFGGILDHTGGVLLCKGDPALNRITKYITQLPESSFNGSTMYIRYREHGEYQVRSPLFTPGLDALNKFECRVGQQYSRFISEVGPLRFEMKVWVPKGSGREIRQVRITNLTTQAIEFDAIPVVEYSHFDALKQLTNADWVPQTMQSRAKKLSGGQIALFQSAFMLKGEQENFFSASIPASSFETDRQLFLGDHGYGSWAAPRSLYQDQLSNTQAQRGHNIGALLLPLGSIEPGQSVEFSMQTGQTTSPSQEIERIEQFFDAELLAATFSEHTAWWQNYLSGYQVTTPDEDFNRLVNVYNPLQVFVTYNWSRYLSLYQLGYGARGMGCRDSAQDVMGAVLLMGKSAKERLRQLLSIQKVSGSAMHQYNPLSMIASLGDSAEKEDRPQYYSDDHLWIVLACCAYLRETGDLELINETIPFYDKDRNEQPLETASVLEHLERAIDFTWGNRGDKGFPLLGFADWNDTVNLPTGAQSLFTAHLFGIACRELAELADHLQNSSIARKARGYYGEMKQKFQETAWDGNWYHRYYKEDGQALGSAKNAVSKIYLNAQTWAVLSGFAREDHIDIAFAHIEKHLATPHGVKLSWPGYEGYDPQVGGVSTYPPGAKENGGIFLHTNPWLIIAETMRGNGDRAYDYLKRILPMAKNQHIDEYECEPYCFPQNILGDEHPQFGLGRNSWLSGVASWAYQATTQYMLGVRSEYEGLRIQPCLPSHWDRVTIEKQIRGTRFTIQISRGSAGEMLVNGQPTAGNLIPYPNNPGGKVAVELSI